MLWHLKNQIEKDTYGKVPKKNYQYWSDNPSWDNDMYYPTFEPTYQFLNAWKAVVNRGDGSVSIEFDPTKLDADAHRSIVTGEDVTDDLADILNLAYMEYKPGVTSGLLSKNGKFVSPYRKPFWTNFIRKMYKEGGARKIIKEEAKKQGLNLE
jgi:hypothetical protein